MAICKYHQKDFDECLNEIDQVLKLNPKNIKALYHKAMVCFHKD